MKILGINLVFKVGDPFIFVLDLAFLFSLLFVSSLKRGFGVLHYSACRASLRDGCEGTKVWMSRFENRRRAAFETDFMQASGNSWHYDGRSLLRGVLGFMCVMIEDYWEADSSCWVNRSELVSEVRVWSKSHA